MIVNFLSIKAIPILFWSSPKALTIRPPFESLLALILGLILFGLGEAVLISSGYGVSPWSAFAQGLANVAGWSIGFATFIISIIILISWIPLKQMPGSGTILNTIIIALVIDFSLPYLPAPDQYFLKLLQATIGILITGFGGGIYLIANLGPGPRDGLITGLQRLTKSPRALVQSIIEITVVIVGFFLGGIIGVGTILFAFGIGPSVAASLYMLQKIFGKK